MTDLRFSGLFDDASQLPPGDLDLGRAVAAHSAWRGGEQSVTRALLADDLETLRLNGLDMEGARELFEAFGTCSISEPIAALIDLGLLGA